MPIDDRVRENVQKLITAGAQEADIDNYMKSEGITGTDLQRIPSPKSNDIKGMSPEALNALPSYVKPAKGPTAIEKPVPEWKQVAMKGINALPEIGQAVGTAAGMASAVASEGATLPLIPGGGAAGRVAGRALQTPLQQLILPKSNPRINASDVLNEGAKGATGAALDAVIPTLGSRFAGKTPSQGLDILIEGTNPKNAIKGATRKLVGGMPERIQERLLKIPYSEAPTPDASSNLVKTTLEKGIEPTKAGYAEVQNKIKGLSGKVDEIIANATNDLNLVDKDKVLENLSNLRNQYAKADMPEYAASLDNYVKGFQEQHPEQFLSVDDAHKLKKFIYATNEGNYGENTYNPVIESRKKIAEGLRKGIEESTGNPELAKTNKELGDYLAIRDVIGRATGRIDRRNPIGLPAEIATNVAAHGTPATISVGSAMAAANNPTVQSKLAQILYRAKMAAGPAPTYSDSAYANLSKLLNIQ